MTKTISFAQAGKLAAAVVGEVPTARLWNVIRTRRLAGQEVDFVTMALLVNQMGKKGAAQFCAAIESTLPKAA